MQSVSAASLRAFGGAGYFYHFSENSQIVIEIQTDLG